MSTNKRLKRSGSSNSLEETKSKRAKFTVTLNPPVIPSTVEAGVVLVTGSGDVGQLGLGPDVLEKNRPALVALDHEIIDVCAGGMHTVCLTKDGKVITFGCNDEGALGRVTSDEEEFNPGVVELEEEVVQISAGDSHTAVLFKDGRVFAWGTFRDSHGNMGMTMNGNEKKPFEILPGHVCVKIASGADHLVILTREGQIYTCGCAEQGQLGRTTMRGSGREQRFGINRFLSPSLVQTKLSLKLFFDDIWAGTYCTFAKVVGKDQIYVFGLNNYSQLGLPASRTTYYSPTLSKEFSKIKWKQISCASHHTIGLSQDGKVYAIGRKDYGRLGLGENCQDTVELKEITGLQNQNCITIGTGTSTSFAVTKKGDLYGWGMGTSGQLGTGEEDDCFEPTLIKGKQLTERSVLKVSSGGQHTVILATTANNNTNSSE